tara:strand:- start:273 stop:455 length:183 start_codon:yes stop_codon:yes gene_type:complete
MLDIKTTETMHEMTVSELREYISDLYSFIQDVTAIREYRARIGEPRLLTAPVEVEFEEEE